MNLLDSAFNGMGGSELYRAELVPDAFPHAPRMRINQWPEEDRQMYVGGDRGLYA
ncbi:hypothetical protein [Mycolicibacterium mucogenicum]|uniref:hypothetical protein n=1 Tax=Mycolicibacterium mucogenicum TaxID=56689 RepID=UPI000AFA7664|nr:hypothetical protein [Mycolicibacterium mucogenicum]